MNLSQRLSIFFITNIIWFVGSILGATWRYRFEGDETYNPKINKVSNTVYCFWHAQQLLFAFGFGGYNVYTIVSASRDGTIVAEVARRWGQGIIRGSSSRKGVSALRECVRVLDKGNNIAITPDGPRGPVYKVKPGVVEIAHLAHAPIVAVSARPSRYWQLTSWDNFIIPKPFATIAITFHAPITLPLIELSPTLIQDTCRAIEKALTS